MKAGELYDLAQLIIPELTRKAFTQFFNLAMDKISREVRLKTNTLKNITSVEQYENLPISSAVKIDKVSDLDQNIYWKVEHGKLLIYDDNKEPITNDTIKDHKLEIEYWARIPEIFKDITAFTDQILDIIEGEEEPVVIDVEKQWSEQEGEITDMETQLCALYLMLTELAGIFPMTSAIIELYANKFQYYFQNIKVKYNTSASPAIFKQVYF
ncbi:MAG TPA: hypothetical protein PLQ59_07670 [Fervidobacterium sp.]|nr:hypothetical protein [Fervidobacterium sp.]